MQKIILVGFLFTSVIAAQSPMPMPAFNNTFTSTLTRGFYFQAPIGFVITGLEVYNEANQPFQVVEVIDFGPNSGPPAYSATVVGTSLFYDNATATGIIIPCSVTCTAGNWYGILAACTASQGGATSYNSYATPSGAFTSSIFGNPTVIQRCGTQTGLGASGPNQPMWSENNGPIARCDVHIAPLVGYATKTLFGTGCNAASPLAIDASARPVLGTTISLDTTNIPAGSIIGSTLLGLTDFPNGLSLTGIGMPGCFQYVSGDANIIFAAPSSSVAVSLVLPNNPAFAGVMISGQSAFQDTSANALGFVSSNAVRLLLDIN